MRKLTLKHCCFCGDLRTGSLISAYLALIRDLILILISIINLSLISTAYALFLDRILIPVFGILLVVAVVNVIMEIILLIGITKYKVGYVKTYFIFNVIEVVIASPLILALCITSKLPGLIPVCIIFLLIHIYYLVVIRSYYLKMDDPLYKPAIYDTMRSPIPADYIVYFKQEEMTS